MNQRHLSFACDPLVVRQFRERRGWTQATLAEKSGYSLRLISKIEAGESASRQSIEDIAEALSTADERVSVEDLTSSPVGLARQYIAAIHTHQAKMFDVIKHFLDDEVVFKMAGDPAVIPFAGTYHGLEGVRELTSRFFACLEVPAGYDHLPHYILYLQRNRRACLGPELAASSGTADERANAGLTSDAISRRKARSFR